jgi:hypothetical protein
MDFNPGVFQQKLNRVQLYKRTSSICKTQLTFSAPTKMRQQSSTDINLYHKQEHQPCTNLCQTTCNQSVPSSFNLFLKTHFVSITFLFFVLEPIPKCHFSLFDPILHPWPYSKIHPCWLLQNSLVQL